MIVYANEFYLVGKNPTLPVLNAVSGWLSKKLKRKITINEIKTIGDLTGVGRTWVRVDRAQRDDYRLYAWTLKHPDKDVRGRQWVIELGVKETEDDTYFSCLVSTNEQSVRVDNKVSATSPNVISFLLDNVEKSQDVSFCSDSIGLSLKKVDNDNYAYKALREDIEHRLRKYPLVLVSPTNSQDYLIDPDKLQKKLIGLAQVVKIDKDFNSYDMEDILGKEFSAWNGTINIVGTPHRDGKIYSTLIHSDELTENYKTQVKRENFILALVSHITNIPRKRNRIKPEGVRALSSRKRLEDKINLFSKEADDHEENKDFIELLIKEIDILQKDKDDLQNIYNQTEDTLLEYEEQIQDLKKENRMNTYRHASQLNAYADSNSEAGNVNKIMDIICDRTDLTPEKVLELVKLAYPKEVVILPEAMQSAQAVADFKGTQRLMSMLHRLIKEYLPKFLEEGDSSARKIFTSNEYSARESDTVKNNDSYMRYRRFTLDGKEIEMCKHLKIGVADNSQETIRVHFEVVQDSRNVVIGHCGEHLPLPGR